MSELKTDVEVLFTPADFATLPGRDLGQTTCVVFDVLRATTAMLAALANGAEAIVPAADIPEAIALRARFPDALLAGERNGVRITADVSGGVDFDLGNSPREFTSEGVGGRVVIWSTTNGTRALRACAQAPGVWLGGWVNLGAVGRALRAGAVRKVAIVCSGTHGEAAYEDALAAGALCDLLWDTWAARSLADSVRMARQLYLAARSDLAAAIRNSRNARRLLAIPELGDDVEFAFRRDSLPVLARLDADGCIRRVG